MDPTRRTVLKMAWGAVAVWVTPVSALGWRPSEEGEESDGESAPQSWSAGPGLARQRVEGMAKVLGRKLYARDFRARDMPGWPGSEQAAMVLHAARVDRVLTGYDLSCLPERLRPVKTVDAVDLERDHVANLDFDSSPPGWPAGFMARVGEPPIYLGQPIAILIFESVSVLRRAHRALQFRDDVVRYGERRPAPPVDVDYPHPAHLTYKRGEFSQVRFGYTNPTANQPTAADRKARTVRGEIEAELEGAGWNIVQAASSTQRIVPMFMEPESGLAWLDGGTLQLVLGTQSPNGAVQDGLRLFDAVECPVKVSEVRLVSCYPGGGFGGRDTSPFTPTLMLAAAYAEGPVRLAYDRFAQFQVGLTQLPARFNQRIAVDADGKFQALHTETVMPSGGKNNYSPFVADLAALSAGGCYSFPRAIVDARATATPDIVAGSMRGFGGTQAAFALETLVEKIAAETGIDSIELRKRNALVQGDETLTGAPLAEPVRIEEICRRAAQDRLWLERAERQAARRGEDCLYGVGFAMAHQAYGVGGDGVMANVALERDGSVLVRTTAVDMGQGSATTLAMGPARWLGSNADRIEMGRVGVFEHLRLSTDAPPDHGKRQGRHAPDPRWEDPHYTAGFALSSSACMTAFQQFHAVTEASRVLFRTGVWPAAVKLWGGDPGREAREGARWESGELRVAGRRALTLAEIAAAIGEQGGVTEALVHAYFSGRWVSARFSVEGYTGRLPIDGLSTRRAGHTDYDWHERSAVEPPPKDAQLYGRSLYAASATLVALTIDPRTGEVRIEDVHSFLDAGKVLQLDLVLGQHHGAVAMGVGQALLEDLTHGPEGAGGGRWNLNRYHVALAGDLPLDRIQLELLPPIGEDSPGKGIAEAVLCPVAPAVANAITHATGHAFTDLPITKAGILEACAR